jgi:hypothetical protein
LQQAFDKNSLLIYQPATEVKVLFFNNLNRQRMLPLPRFFWVFLVLGGGLD